MVTNIKIIKNVLVLLNKTVKNIVNVELFKSLCTYTTSVKELS